MNPQGPGNGEIRIDREANWYYNGLPIVNRNIYRFFNQHVEHASGGGYELRIGNETCPLLVEDTPFVVQLLWQVEAPGQGFAIRLNDGTEEPFAVETLRISTGDVPYCRVRDGRFPARLLRPAWNALAPYVDCDAQESGWAIQLDGQRWPIEIGPD